MKAFRVGTAGLTLLALAACSDDDSPAAVTIPDDGVNVPADVDGVIDAVDPDGTLVPGTTPDPLDTTAPGDGDDPDGAGDVMGTLDPTGADPVDDGTDAGGPDGAVGEGDVDGVGDAGEIIDDPDGTVDGGDGDGTGETGEGVDDPDGMTGDGDGTGEMGEGGDDPDGAVDVDGTGDTDAEGTSGTGAPDGVRVLASVRSVDEALGEIELAIGNAPAAGVLARVDHAANAASVGETLPPTAVVLFGNPALGTPLMQARRTAGLDLPQRMLAYEAEDGDVTLAWNTAAWLAARHGLDASDETVGGALDTIDQTLAMLAGNAAGDPSGANGEDAASGDGEASESGEDTEGGEADGEFADDEFMEDEFSEDEFSEDEFAEDEFSEDEFSEDEFAEDEFSEDEFSEDEFSEDEFAEDEFSEGEFAEDEFLEGEFMEGGDVDGEAGEGEATEGDAAESETDEGTTDDGGVTVAEGDGIVVRSSANDFETTWAALKGAIEAAGPLGIAAELDHAANAERAGLTLPPTRLIVFGNPAAGTPLMQSARTIGLDLPQKMLVWAEEDGSVSIAWNDPAWLAERHGISGQDERLAMIAAALEGLAGTAAGDGGGE